MYKENSKVRSQNNNVFYYCAYWQSWSRVLFHDSGGRGLLKMRQEYAIPDSHRTIEVNVYDRANKEGQERNSKIVIRSHSTEMCRSACDKIAMELPQDVSETILKSYEPDVYSLITHADLLKYIDFNKLRGPKNNGGCELADCLVDGLTIFKLNQLLLSK